MSAVPDGAAGAEAGGAAEGAGHDEHGQDEGGDEGGTEDTLLVRMSNPMPWTITTMV